MFRKNRLLKTISYGLMIALSVSIGSDASYGFMPQAKTSIPIGLSTAGRVIERYDAKGQGHTICQKPFMYVIQSLHCHAGVQKNISKIIGQLKEKHGNNLSVVGIEGSIGKIDTNSFENISHKKIQKKLVEYFTEKGDLQGAEIYALQNPKQVELYGIEDEEVYGKNFGQLYNSILQQDRMNEMLLDIEKTIKRGKEVLYTESLREFEKMVKQYEDGRIGFDEYLQYLFGKYSVVADLSANFESKSHTRLKSKIIRQEYPEIAKQLKAYEKVKNINEKQVMWEAGEVVKQLAGYLSKEEKNNLKAVQGTEQYYTYLTKLLNEKNVMYGAYRNLTQYLSYLAQKEEINESRLFVEMDEMRYEIAKNLARGEHPRMLVYCDEYRRLLEKYTSNCVSIYEKEKWEKGRDQFYRVANEMTSKLQVKNVFENIEKDLKKADQEMGTFYKTADKRNEIMVRNMLKHLQTKDQSHVSSRPFGNTQGMATARELKAIGKYNRYRAKHIQNKIPQSLSLLRNDTGGSAVSLMIIGGYHTRGITEILRSKGISYEVIMPNVEGIYDRGLYEKKVKEQAEERIQNPEFRIQKKNKRSAVSLELVSMVGSGALDGVIAGVMQVEQKYGRIQDVKIEDTGDEVQIEYILRRRRSVKQVYERKDGIYGKLEEAVDIREGIDDGVRRLVSLSEENLPLFLDSEYVDPVTDRVKRVREEVQTRSKETAETLLKSAQRLCNELMRKGYEFVTGKGVAYMASRIVAGGGKGEEQINKAKEALGEAREALKEKNTELAVTEYNRAYNLILEAEKLGVKVQELKKEADRIYYGLDKIDYSLIGYIPHFGVLILSKGADGEDEEESDTTRIKSGKIVLEKKIGGGRFGDVFKGTLNGRLVAIKRNKKGEDLKEGQRMEAINATQLKHPNVVEVISHGEGEDGYYYMVMEYCEGGDLRKWIEENRSIREKWEAGLEIARGLEYIHEEGMVHRDLKDENILLDEKGRCKISDMGQAQVFGMKMEEAEAKVVGDFVGDLGWASPEELLEKRADRKNVSTAESDMYRYGLVLWNMLTGEKPQGQETYNDAEKERTRRLSVLPADCPQKMREVISRCLDPEPKKRMKAEEVVRELESIAVEVCGEEGLGIRISRRMESILHSRKNDLEEYEEQYTVERDIREDMDTYLQRIEKKEAKEEHPELQRRLMDFLGKEERVLSVLGDAGTGKTLSMHAFAERLLKGEQKSAEGKAYLPIMIRPAIKDWTQEGIRDGIEKTLRFYGINENEWEILRQRYKVVFILDGYDEMEIKGERENIPRLLGMEKWENAKLVITSRRDTIKETEESGIWGIGRRYDRIYVLPFDIDQMMRYLRKRLDWDEKTAETYKEKLINTESLRTVLRTPFVLSLMIKAWEKVEKELQDEKRHELTRSRIYELFVEDWLEKNKGNVPEETRAKLGEMKRNYDEFAGRAAYQALSEKQQELGVWGSLEQEAREEARKKYKKYVEERKRKRILMSKEDWEKEQVRMIKQMWEKAPVKMIEGSPKFMHKTFQEYYAARYMMRTLIEGSFEKQIEVFNGCNIIKELKIREFFIEMYDGLDEKEREQIKKSMFDIVLSTREHARNTQAGANAITMLNDVRTSFSGMDLREIRIQGADLRQGMFDCVDLRGADLRDVVFKDTFLARAKFSRANMNGVYFGQFAHINLGKNEIDSITYSPCGRYIASGSSDKTVKLWDVETGVALKTFFGHSGAVYGVEFSPDGKKLASRSGDKTVKLWDVETGIELRTFPVQIAISEKDEALGLMFKKFSTKISGDLYNLIFSPDGKKLASGGSFDNTVMLWDIETGVELILPVGINNIVFSPDSKKLVSGSGDNTVKLWDVETGHALKTFSEHSDAVYSLIFSPDGRKLASGSRDKTVKLWDIESEKCIATLQGHNGPVTNIIFSPDSKKLASGSYDKTVKLWDVETGHALKTFSGHTDVINSVIFSPDGTTIASASYDKTVRLWDVESGGCCAIFQGHSSGVRNVTFFQDGKIIASGSFDSEVKLWEARSAKYVLPSIRKYGHVKSVKSVNFFPDGKTIISVGGYEDNTMKLWDVKSGRCFATLQGHSKSISNIDISRDGKSIASGSYDKTVKLWDVESGRCFATLQGHSDEVTDVSFSPDGKTIASGSGYEDKTVRLWDVETRKCIAIFRGHERAITNLSFSPNGKIIASGNYDRTIRLWDVETRKCIAVLGDRTNDIRSLSFSPDGRIIAAVGGSYRVELWDVETGKCIVNLKGHSSSLEIVTFSPDGTTIASASYDKTVRLWDVKTKKCIATLEEHSHPPAFVTFSPDSKIVASGKGSIVKLWDTKSGRYLGFISGHNDAVSSVDFSPDGKIMVSGSADHSVKLWDVGRLFERGKEPIVLWSSSHPLFLVGATIQGSRLSEVNARLLKQRGAKGEPEIEKESVGERKKETTTQQKHEFVKATISNLPVKYPKKSTQRISEKMKKFKYIVSSNILNISGILTILTWLAVIIAGKAITITFIGPILVMFGLCITLFILIRNGLWIKKSFKSYKGHKKLWWKVFVFTCVGIGITTLACGLYASLLAPWVTGLLVITGIIYGIEITLATILWKRSDKKGRSDDIPLLTEGKHEDDPFADEKNVERRQRKEPLSFQGSIATIPASKRLAEAKYEMNREGLKQIQSDIETVKEEVRLSYTELLAQPELKKLRQMLINKKLAKRTLRAWEEGECRYEEIEYPDGMIVLSKYKKDGAEPIDIQILESPVIDMELIEKALGSNSLIRVINTAKAKVGSYMEYLRKVLLPLYNPITTLAELQKSLVEYGITRGEADGIKALDIRLIRNIRIAA